MQHLQDATTRSASNWAHTKNTCITGKDIFMKGLGSSLRDILGIIIGALFLLFFVAHHLQYQKLYPEGTEAKFIEAEGNCMGILTELALPGMMPNETTKFIRKPEVPSGHISQTYTTTLSWEQIQKIYLDKAQKGGWMARIVKSSQAESYIDLQKGPRNDRYGVDITLKNNCLRIFVQWEGLALGGK